MPMSKRASKLSRLTQTRDGFHRPNKVVPDVPVPSTPRPAGADGDRLLAAAEKRERKRAAAAKRAAPPPAAEPVPPAPEPSPEASSSPAEPNCVHGLPMGRGCGRCASHDGVPGADLDVDELPPAPFVPPDPDPLHPTGRCSCWGEGTCDWCMTYNRGRLVETSPATKAPDVVNQPSEPLTPAVLAEAVAALPENGVVDLAAVRASCEAAVQQLFSLERDAVSVVAAAANYASVGGNAGIARRGSPAEIVKAITLDEIELLDRLLRVLRQAGDPIADYFDQLRPVLDRRYRGLVEVAKQRVGIGPTSTVGFLVKLTEEPMRRIAEMLQGRAVGGALAEALRSLAAPEA